MEDMQVLYEQYRSDIELIVGHLVDVSFHLLERNGNFLPHGAAKMADGEFRLVAAGPSEGDETTSTEILPNLYDALRSTVSQHGATAVAAAENVHVTFEGTKPSDAVKVQYENEAGLTVAFYAPFKRKLLGGIKVSDLELNASKAEIVPAWERL